MSGEHHDSSAEPAAPGPAPQEPELLRLATIGPAHALSGQVRLIVHTDDPEGRLRPGAELRTDPPEAGPLTITDLRWLSKGLHARFAGHTDRSAAEALRGVVLLGPPVPEQEAWYPHELRGLQALAPDGSVLGVIEGVQHLPAQDALVLRTRAGEQVLVPLVAQIVPTVDPAAGTVIIDAPAGLLPEDVEHR